MITEPGLYEMDAADYHADPCETISLSASIAKELVNHTPLNAWWNHPRLNPKYEPKKPSADMIFGTAVHAALLEPDTFDDQVIPVYANDFKTNDAKEYRDEILADGKTPLIESDYEEVKELAERSRQQINIDDEYPGPSEWCAIADFNGVMARCRPDRLAEDHRTVVDIKVTRTDHAPTPWNKYAVGMGYDISQGLYRQTLASILAIDVARIDYLFLSIQRGPPITTQLIRLPIENADTGLEKAAFARAKWAECMEKKSWPGPPKTPQTGEPVSWDVALWEMRKLDQRLINTMAAYAPDELAQIGL